MLKRFVGLMLRKSTVCHNEQSLKPFWNAFGTKQAEILIKATFIDIQSGGERACYDPALDRVLIPFPALIHQPERLLFGGTAWGIRCHDWRGRPRHSFISILKMNAG